MKSPTATETGLADAPHERSRPSMSWGRRDSALLTAFLVLLVDSINFAMRLYRIETVP